MVENALRSTLLFLSQKEELKDVATRLAPFRRLSRRYVAGETRQEALQVVAELNARGCLATLDHLGEDVLEPAQTDVELKEYVQLVRSLHHRRLGANVSVKLSQLGLAFDEELAFRQAHALVAEAKRHGIFVRLDMEGSALTDATLRVFRRLRETFGVDDVGVALQAYLRRTEQDARLLLELPARIRLCKGAYKEPPEKAYPRKKDVDENFVRVAKLLLDSGRYHALATHDPKMIDASLDYAQARKIEPGAFELQMLYGIRRDLQEALASQGHPVRVYVPYGKSWYPYLMRRLAERPANLWFVAKNALR